MRRKGPADGACPIQVGSLPIGTEALRQVPIGADTEVRRPWAERVEERKSRVEFGGPFSGADTEDRAVVEQACQPVRERRHGSAARRISVDGMVPRGRRVVRIGPTDLEVCRHDRADTKVRDPAALDLVGVTVLWIERLAPSPGLSATLSPTGARDTIQASARPCHALFPVTAQRRQPRVPPLPRIDVR